MEEKRKLSEDDGGYGFMLTPENREKSLMRRETSISEAELLYGGDELDPLYFKTVRPSISLEEWVGPIKRQAIKEFQKVLYRPKEEEVAAVKQPDEEPVPKTAEQLLDLAVISAMSVGEVIPIKEMEETVEEEEEKEETCTLRFDKWTEEKLMDVQEEKPRTTEELWKNFFVQAKEEFEERPKQPIYRNINDVYQFRARIKNCTYTTINKYYSRILKKDIAIKIIPKTGIPDQRLFKFVPGELDVAEDEDFGHPNIVKFFETHDVILRCYIMMEYVDNGNLTEYIQSRGRLDPLTYQRFFSHLIKAVNYCHRYGICHRKISTENCLITKDLDLKLCDFSYSRRIRNRDDVTNTYCGVLGYTAPEILMCRNYQPCMTDAWSCGVVLFVMVYGAMPFDSSNFPKLLRQVQQPIKYHWYCDTPLDAIMIMHQTISPISRRWSVRKVLGHHWVTPSSSAGYEYYMELYKKEIEGPSIRELGRRLIEFMERVKTECIIPLKMKQEENMNDDKENNEKKEVKFDLNR